MMARARRSGDVPARRRPRAARVIPARAIHAPGAAGHRLTDWQRNVLLNATMMMAIILNAVLLASAASSTSAYKPSQRMSVGLWPMPAEVRHAGRIRTLEISTVAWRMPALAMHVARCCRSAFTPLHLPLAAGPGHERKHNSICRQF
eukprot:COSAG02_NODE_770_length_17362_cov_42.372125_15_plen_147_part_00